MATSFLLILAGMALYGGLHSLLAGERVKAWAERSFGAAARRGYRLAFNLIGAVTFVPVLALAALLPDAPLYRVPAPFSLLFEVLQMLGVAILVAGLLQTGLASFLGLAQLAGRAPDAAPRLVTGGVYGWMRHPLYTGGMMAVWFSPVMSWNILALVVGISAYLVIGARLEERRLLREFGPAYEAYRGRTGMFLPRWKS